MGRRISRQKVPMELVCELPHAWRRTLVRALQRVTLCILGTLICLLCSGFLCVACTEFELGVRLYPSWCLSCCAAFHSRVRTCCSLHRCKRSKTIKPHWGVQPERGSLLGKLLG